MVDVFRDRTAHPGERCEPSMHAPAGDQDLVDDRAVQESEDDLLDHATFVDELAHLCLRVSSPASIALYGSWGTGKSSIGNMLGQQLATHKTVAFARFDAHKYSEIPLRRLFLSQVAAQVGISDEAFHGALYESRTTNVLQRSPLHWRFAAKVLLVVALLMLALLAMASLVFALLATRPFAQAFAAAIRQHLPTVLVSTPIIAAVISVLAQHLTVTTVRNSPSDEEFEQLFRGLVENVRRQKNVSRIVIFFDELDRCSPGEVAGILESLRAFLDVDPCISIVAADQQVLEHALSEAVRQATPPNATNPYYSSGSAYLDKIFQYQLTIPPLMPRRLTRFAVNLVEGRAGIWDLVPNKAQVVSVLVPAHVSSPRRVKHLLNAFALLYRIALERSRNGLLPGDISSRATEIAKLAALQVEFPLFARDLQLDYRLPELITRKLDDPALDLVRAGYAALSEETLEKVRQYVDHEAPADELLLRNGEAASESRDGVLRAQSQTLQRYLLRTKGVPGPGRDIVYLQGPGSGFGLDPHVAQELEDAAVDGRYEVAVQLLAELDNNARVNGLHFLARLATDTLGVETDNVTRALLGAVSTMEESVAASATDIVAVLEQRELLANASTEDLGAVATLAAMAQGTDASRLRAQLLDRADTRESSAAIQAIMRDAAAFLDASPSSLASLIADLIVEDRAAELRSHMTQPPDSVSDLVLAEIDAAVAESTRRDDDDGDDSHPHLSHLLGILARASAELSGTWSTFARALIAFLLSLDRQEARAAMQEVLPGIGSLIDDDLAPLLARNIRLRPTSVWPQWLELLQANSAQQVTGLRPALEAMVVMLMRRRFVIERNRDTEENQAAAWEGIKRVLGEATLDSPDLGSQLGDFLSDVVTPQTLDAHRAVTAALNRLARDGLHNLHSSAAQVLTSVRESLATTPGAAATTASGYDGGSGIAGYLIALTRSWVPHADADDIQEVNTALTESPWIDRSSALAMRLELAIRARELGMNEPVITPQEVTTLLSDEGDDVAPMFGRWLKGLAPRPQEVWLALQPILADLDDDAFDVLHGWTDAISESARLDLFESMRDQYVSGEVDERVLRAIRLSETPQRALVRSLIDAYESATTIGQRSRVLIAWEVANITSDSLRRELVDKVFIPFLEMGSTALDFALSHFGLVQGVRGVRKRVRHAITEAVGAHPKLGNKAERVLRDAEWVRTRRRRLRRVTEAIEEPDDQG